MSSSSFIPTGTEQADVIIANNGFFPDLSLNKFRTQMRVDQTASTERAELSLRNAVVTINGELRAWGKVQQDNGYSKLELIPAQIYGAGDDAFTEKEHYYEFAVYNRAKAELIEKYRDFDSTKSGHSRSDELDPRIDDHMREANESLRFLQDLPRTTVELI